jgi:hypothetical protein
MNERRIPLGRQQDALVVAEPPLASLIMERLRSEGQLSPEARVVTVAVRPERGGEAATMRDLFRAALSLPVPGQAMLGGGGDASMSAYPLALWPLFGNVYVQRDWALGPDPDDWSLNFPMPDEEWWLSRRGSSEEREFQWRRRRHGPEDFKDWARWAQLPAGQLLLSVLRHEYSVDERTVLAAITDCDAGFGPGRGHDEPVREGEVLYRVLKELDSNDRIWSGCRGRPLVRLGSQDRHAPTSPWVEAEAAWMKRIMHAAFARECWRPMELLDRIGRETSLEVVFCDDHWRNVRGFLSSVGVVGSDDPERDSRAYRVLLPPAKHGATGEPFSSEDPHQWDEELASLVEVYEHGSGGTPADRDPLFILCDYDLDTSHARSRPQGIRSLGVPVTGAKLAALTKGHLARRFPGRTISAIAFTGGSSPVIARECIELGCDFVIRKGIAQSRGGGTHVSADVGGLSSLALWVWSITCHDRFLRCILSALDGGESHAVELLEGAYRAVVRREIAVPRSLEHRMTEVRERALRTIRSIGSPRAEG